MTEMIMKKTYTYTKKNHDKSIENFWVNNGISADNISVIKNNETELNSLLNLASKFVCIATNDKLPQSTQETISELYRRGIRVYLLTNTTPEEYKRSIAGKCIIRFADNVQGNYILIDPSEHQFHWRGGFLPRLSLEGAFTRLQPLTGPQLKEAFQYFIEKFWMDSMFEIRTYDEFNNPKEIESAPNYVFPLFNPKYFLYSDFEDDYSFGKIEQIISKVNKKLTIGCSSLDNLEKWIGLIIDKINTLEELTIYTNLKLIDTTNFNFLDAKNTRIYSSLEFDESFILIDDSEGVVLNNRYEHENIGLYIEGHEVTEYQNWLNANKVFQSWSFQIFGNIGELGGKGIIFDSMRNADRPELNQVTVSESETIILGSFEAETLRQMNDDLYKPEFPEGGSLSSESVYTWELVPKIRGTKAKKDPLYNEWDEALNTVKNELEDLKKSIKTTETKILGKPVGILDMWKKNLTKFKRIGDGTSIDRMLAQLSQKDIFTPEKFGELAEQSEDLIEKYQADIQLVESNIKKEEYNEDYQEKLIQLRTCKEESASIMHTAKQAFDDGTKKSNTNTSELDDNILEIELLEEEAKQSEKILLMEYPEIVKLWEGQQNKRKITGYLSKKIDEISKLKKKKIETFYQDTLTQTEKLIEEYFADTEYINELMGGTKIKDRKQLLEFLKTDFSDTQKFHIREPKEHEKKIIEKIYEVRKNIEDLNEERVSLEKEKNELLTKATVELTRLKKEYERSAEAYLKAEENINSLINSKKDSDSFITNDTLRNHKLNINIPVESLPRVGTLYIDGKKRQLAIQNWEELDLGEEESRRLSAELVTEV